MTLNNIEIHCICIWRWHNEMTEGYWITQGWGDRENVIEG
jgi:hypothetical protein